MSECLRTAFLIVGASALVFILPGLYALWRGLGIQLPKPPELPPLADESATYTRTSSDEDLKAGRYTLKRDEMSDFDWRKILKAYIEHVRHCEGIIYLPVEPDEIKALSPEELAALNELAVDRPDLARHLLKNSDL